MADDYIYAGIDIGGTNIKYGLFDRKGKVIHKEQRPTLAEKGADPLMHLVTNIGESLLYWAAEEEKDVRWLGVGSPGAINNQTGKVIGQCPNIAGWQGMDIASVLNERLNIPVHVDNDVNCMALAESRFGAAVGYDSVVCVAVGTGVGGGVILNGKLWRGSSHSGGEIGHLTIDYDGPKCACGSRGCIEVYCASAGIISRTKDKLKGGLTEVFDSVLDDGLDSLTIKKLFLAAKKNDSVALEVIQETAEKLGAGLTGVINLLNPQALVIGGGVAEGGAGFVEAVAEEIRKRAFDSATENLRVARATLGNDAGFIGAGLLGDL